MAARAWLAIVAVAVATPSVSQDDGRASAVALRSSSGEYLGAGIVVTQDGYIVTSGVVGAGDAFACSADGREHAARYVGGDQHMDIGVFKLQGPGLPAARIADLTKLKAGDAVLCVGVASQRCGFEIARGSVRELDMAFQRSPLVPYIETNVGDCDGPLFNGRGELVALNRLFRADEPERAFAIPIDAAMKVQRQLASHGRVRHGRLGLVFRELTAELAAEKGLQSAAGALIHSVEQGGPAQRAGIRAGDILVEVGGKPVARSRNAIWLIVALEPGVTTTLRVWRDGSFQTLSARAGLLVQPAQSQ